MMQKDIISKNLEIIKNNIEKSCIKANRKIEDIEIIGVTKTIDIERIKILKELGISTFGENKAQELLEKYDNINDVSWHFIGNLQTNKVKYIIDKVKLIHSVNSLRLLEEIDKRALSNSINMPILLEINIANEQSKSGLLQKDLEPILEYVKNFKNITLNGLMCVAPFVENPKENAQYFRKMRKLFVDIASKNKDNINMKYLSMGMTNDYGVAIEEGANIIRIGTGIFGKRNY
ncbi:YggS family pyridoxal phosphate-dependent enzyme [uncultured Tyzzerella sp.]|uniref:YggS family pyridoxal phosphate-dependent enzyme n=1 Tax=uncultured Tyzzerella sp. TaxID=2321398 RepID=UPI0029424E06|nr:YggS family pyridoxal phosphate-dependent enzyme [uncultured Tyzzerella sp.]